MKKKLIISGTIAGVVIMVAVVGGGNTALEDTLYLSNIASKVYLIHRRDEFRADKAIVDKVNNKDNIELVLNSNVTKLIGNDKLEEIEINNSNTIKVDGLFIAVGHIPETENFSEMISLDENGYVLAGENCCTSIPGIFVAGDCRVKELRQLVTATSDGAIAATEAIKYINNK